VAVGNGEAVLKRREETEPFDLVALHVILPGMDGVHVCREILTGEAWSASSGVLILMLTAHEEFTGSMRLPGQKMRRLHHRKHNMSISRPSLVASGLTRASRRKLAISSLVLLISVRIVV
jgi:CheY-like chemotaxis protein